MPAPADPALLRVLETRSALLASIRQFFADRGFIEVETPAIVPSPGLDPHLRAFEVRNPNGRPVGWLATSPEYQMKRLLCEGAERVFQLGRSYRAEEHGQHHEREFTMLEWYRADATSDEVIADTEALVASAARELGRESPELEPPWQRITVDDALRLYASRAPDAFADDDEAFFQAWAEQVQPNLGEERPVVVTDWPGSMASLARLKPDGRADRFEAFFRGVELCNGFGELTDAAEQRRRLEHDRTLRRAIGAPVYPIDERFLESLQKGMPESAGNALGVDRLLMLLLGADSIQSVMAFPVERL